VDAVTFNQLSRPGVESITHPSRWLLPIILLGNVLNVFDTFVVNVALPTLSQTLHANSADLELVVAGYSVAYACLLVTGGRLGDTYGRRRLYLIGMTGFVAASAACGTAPTATILIVARLVQGATAALVVPQVLAIIQVTYTGHARQRALGMFGAVMGLAGVAAQILGGILVSADVFGLSWRPAFLLNIPVGVVGVLAARRVIPESRAERPAPIDGWGTAMLGSAVVLLLLPLAIGHDDHWPLWGWLMMAAAVPVAVAFFIVQTRAERRGVLPLLPPSLLRSPGMRRGLPVGVGVFMAYGGMMLTTTVSLQYGLRYSAIKAGLTFSSYAVGFMLGSLVARRLVARFGRLALIGGGLIFGLGCGLVALTTWSGYDGLTPVDLAPGLAVIGAGQATLMIPLMGATLNGVPADRTGVASGVWSTNQQISRALGTVVMGTLFFSVAATHGYGSATVAAALAEAALAALAGLGSWRLRPA
jgi:MFS family permease